MALMKMIDKPGEGISDTCVQEPAEIPVITWVGDSCPVLMNDYEDAEYFTGAFPTLFPYGRGGHLYCGISYVNGYHMEADRIKR